MYGNEKDKLLKELWSSLTDEQKEKVEGCQTTEELMELAGKEGIELPGETLDAIAGGRIAKEDESNMVCYARCPYCKKEHYVQFGGGTVRQYIELPGTRGHVIRVKSGHCDAVNRTFYSSLWSGDIVYDDHYTLINMGGC